MAHDQQTTATDREIADQQSDRLRLLRELSGLRVSDAAAAARISRFAWSRMERRQSKIDMVSLLRFCDAVNLPGDYVIAGTIAGVPRELLCDLLALEAREAAAQVSAAGASA